MFKWLFGDKQRIIESETRKGFSAVKNDIESVGKWIKHLDEKDKQLFKVISDVKQNISSIRNEIDLIRESLTVLADAREGKQVFKKLPVLNKQTVVGVVEDDGQTAVQTGDIYDILRKLSSNERLIVFTLINSEMKVSYEDLALLLGKERSTIRGQINSIKQKAEGLIEEITEKNGKKRVFIPVLIKEKLQKYAKVRVGKKKKE
ncbi:MAG: hypothetical protein Q7S74_02555 [Nanoarchaeota archaeon]|nr:hypothetical protein [Nanoarchaeota archaeon]